MLRRLRRLKMSLATKCQLLFGIAAGIIILAALVITWQRIEQLTQQQDTVVAQTMAKQVLAMHAATGQLPPPDPPFDLYDGLWVRRPRLVGIDGAADLTPFEGVALSRLEGDRSQWYFSQGYLAEDGREGYRLAAGAFLDTRCTACHSAPGAQRILPDTTTQPLLFPFSPLTTRPSEPDTVGAPGITVLLPDPPGEDGGEGAPGAGQPALAEARPGDEVDEDERLPLIGLVSVDIPSQIRARQRLLNRVFLIVASLAAAATATITLYFILTRLILNPMRVLQETAERVREGDLNVRSDIPSGDEFQTLSETFNSMLGVLQDRNEQLRKANVGLDRKLDQLAATNVALDESNRLKGEFLANVSHELRTPLNSILGFADLLKEAGRDNAKILRYANNIHASGGNLLDLINDLLDLAKIEAGRMELRLDSLSISDMFEALVTLLGPLANKRLVLVEPQVVPHVPLITTDPGKLQQILYNLLSNAIKFSPPGGRVDLIAQREDAGHVRISVGDEGPGIAPENQEQIFEKFRQLDQGMTRQHTGTGLGLAISRELADLLGGRLGVDSVPGQGATFWLVIPIELAAKKDENRRVQRAGV